MVHIQTAKADCSSSNVHWRMAYYLFIYFLRKTCFQFYSHIWEKNGWHAQIIEYLMGPRQLVFRIRLSFLFFLIIRHIIQERVHT